MIIVTGDSHAGPLGRAIDREGNPATADLKRRFGGVAAAKLLAGHRFREPFFEVNDDAVWLCGEAGKTIAELAGTDGALRARDGHCYGFSMGFHTAILLRQEYWRNFTLLSRVPDKAFVSAAVYRRMVLQDNAQVLMFARALIERDVDAFFLAGAPIRGAMIERQASFAEREELLAIHEQYIATMEQTFEAMGMPFVRAPEEASEDGVLKPELDSRIEGDVHHGNVGFGLLQWQAIKVHCLKLESMT